uniref:Uncharacterized protein n=1 Tax=Timema bartmani TaxID=61472 RepID=A0A7R9HZ71_9NEOP|nr:unnamed protein product [Timema bartmani]
MEFCVKESENKERKNQGSKGFRVHADISDYVGPTPSPEAMLFLSTPFWKKHPQCTQLGSSSDLPVFGSLVQHEINALDHVATEAESVSKHTKLSRVLTIIVLPSELAEEKGKVHSTEIRTSISPSSAVELNTTSTLANYATEAKHEKVTAEMSISENLNPIDLGEDVRKLISQTAHIGCLNQK